MSISIHALTGIPLVQAGDDLATLLVEAFQQSAFGLEAGDVIVVTSKIVSKAEGRVVSLAEVIPTDEALHYAAITQKDPRLVQLVLNESSAVSRAAPGVLIVTHRLGFVCANAGIDQSNLENGDDYALLLPLAPDETARQLWAAVKKHFKVSIGVIISDSQGRPFRLGNIGVAIGVAGMPAILDLRGQPDLFGRKLKISIQGYADLVASAAQLVTGEGAEGRPVAIVRGLDYAAVDGSAKQLNRQSKQDLYR